MKLPTNRNFGIVFGIFFLILFVYFYVSYKLILITKVFFFLSFTFFTLGLLNSKILTPLNYLWTKFGIYLGKILSPIIMMIIFFLIVTPIGLLMRILRKDLINLKFNNRNTYWIKREGQKSKMKNQF
tara:strand:+ start:23 stop:403 length:381 start_codon:yes stop_codon:yes gene_type:complete